jgi:RNA polymerase sigma-70 factor (ECF subfamily)
MNTLSEEQKTSVKLFYFEEKSYADIVEITGYALNKVKSYIQNGKRNLKTCILNILK